MVTNRILVLPNTSKGTGLSINDEQAKQFVDRMNHQLEIEKRWISGRNVNNAMFVTMKAERLHWAPINPNSKINGLWMDMAPQEYHGNVRSDFYDELVAIMKTGSDHSRIEYNVWSEMSFCLGQLHILDIDSFTWEIKG